MSIKSINPATGETIVEYGRHTEAEIDVILARVDTGAAHWRYASFAKRARGLRDLAVALREQAPELAALMAREMGKPIPQGEAEVEKCAWVCDYYAEHGQRLLRPLDVATDAHRSTVAFEPLGTILLVMPWNFPLWQVFRVAAPTLMAGNTLVLRHASNVPGCATAIARLFAECDMPDDIFGLVFADKHTMPSIIQDARIKAVSVTGSPQAGSSIAATAGAALKKTVLELGGSDPYLILADADIPAAARECAKSRLINSGQSCIAAKRFVVVESVLEEFTDAMIDELGAKRMGDPLQEEVDLGPLAHTRLRDKLHAQVTHSIDKGAQCMLGGQVPDGPGAFYPPTVLAAVAPGMPAYEEEVFGPVASIIAADDTNDAVRIANDTVYGLGAAVFTSDREFGESLARDRLRAGVVCVNTFVRSDPRLPFGGIERSGYGRELGSFGLKEFVNTKVVYIA